MTRILLRVWLVLLGLSVGGMAIGLLVFVTTGNAHANAVLQQPFQPTSINRMVSSSSVINASTRFAGVTAANQSVFAVKAVNIGKASIANAVRTRSLTPWGLGIITAMTAAGYFLDDGEWLSNDTPQGYSVMGNCRPSSGINFDSTFGECLAYAQNVADSRGVPLKTQDLWTDRFYFYSDISPSDGRSSQIAYFHHPANVNNQISYDPNFRPLVTNDQVFDVFTNLSPSTQQDILTDPLTGFPDAATIPEFQQAADQISSNWNANNDGDPNTVPEPDPTEQTSEEPFPEEQPEQDICKANPEILACQELGETPDETPIGEQELPFDYQPVSFSGNASCPASIQMGGGIQYDYDAACSFASGVKPAVITMALLTGVFVMGGFRR
jgi:hypothetical protein